MSNTPDIAALLAAQLADPTTSWSIGTFGAIAEFMRDPHEPVIAGADKGLSAVTDRGGIRIEPARRPAAFRVGKHHAHELESARRALPAG